MIVGLLMNDRKWSCPSTPVRLVPLFVVVADKSRLPCSWVCCSESHARRKRQETTTALSVKTKVTEVRPGRTSASVCKVGKTPRAPDAASYRCIGLFPPDAPSPVSAAAPSSSNLLGKRSAISAFTCSFTPTSGVYSNLLIRHSLFPLRK